MDIKDAIKEVVAVIAESTWLPAEVESYESPGAGLLSSGAAH